MRYSLFWINPIPPCPASKIIVLPNKGNVLEAPLTTKANAIKNKKANNIYKHFLIQ